MNDYKLISEKNPKGDQPKSIKKLISNFKDSKEQILWGSTGTGKTYTIANVIEKLNVPTLVMAQNKTLAQQLYVEFKNLFPKNRVEYFISNFDFYRPEAYLPRTDTYLEKTSKSNWEIETLRLSTLNALTSRKDVIVVASVASIYGLRPPEEYKKHHIELNLEEKVDRKELILKLIRLSYKRTNSELNPGHFLVRGDIIELSPSWTNDFLFRFDLFGGKVEELLIIDKLNKNVISSQKSLTIFPGDENVVKVEEIKEITKKIRVELKDRLKYFEKNNMLLERERLDQRINFDIEQLEETGTCSGIENYSFYFDGYRKTGEPPNTLIDYFPKDFLLIMDESHISVPQINGMYEGDRSRKKTLVEYGFRLPSALDNRPLKFKEFEGKMNKVIYASATPGQYETEKTDLVVEQIIRPTGLLDPKIEVKNTENQIDDLIEQIHKRKKKNERVLVSVITKKMSEDVSSFLREKGLNVAYVHSDLKTFERTEIIRKLRLGVFDALVGINLLREGIDLPEVSLVAILDADKEGFLRNERSLIQLIGRASRNVNGRAILYADLITKSIKNTIELTNNRRELQEEYNSKNNIKPKSIVREIEDSIVSDKFIVKILKNQKKLSAEKIADLEKEMNEAAKNKDFERAIILRDLIIESK